MVNVDLAVIVLDINSSCIKWKQMCRKVDNHVHNGIYYQFTQIALKCCVPIG